VTCIGIDFLRHCFRLKRIAAPSELLRTALPQELQAYLVADLGKHKMFKAPRFPKVLKSELRIAVSQLGSGASCVVHRAEYKGKQYALKLYHQRVAREIQRELAVAPYCST
jgi:hypothetical protein